MKKYPFVKQEEFKDCGAACLSMIINYYNGYIDYEEIKDLTKITRDGTTAYHIIEAAHKIGFKATGVECTLDTITKENIILPCIANVIINNSYRHFIVIYEINFKKGYLVIGDPSNKLMKMSFDIFKSIFSGVLIILYPERTLPINVRSKKSILIIWDMLKIHTPLLFQIVILSLLFSLFSIAASFYVEMMINAINKTNSLDYLLFIFVIFAFIYLMKVISNFFRDKILLLLTQKVDLVLTMDTFKKVLLLPYHYYRNRTTGEIISRIQDLTPIKGLIVQFLVTTIIDLPLTLIAFGFLYAINDKLCGIALLMAFLYLIIIYCFQPIIVRYVDSEQQARASINSYMVESISGFESVKGLKMENRIFNHFEKKYVKYLNLNGRHQNVYIIEMMLKDLVYCVGFLIITLIGSWYVIENKITLGNLITFHSLLFYFLNPIQSMINLNNEWKEVKNAIKRVSQMYLEKGCTGFLEDKMSGDIEFKNVSYSFNDRDKVLQNVSLMIRQGEKLMIVGKSGSGKSTLLKLLMKYYNVARDNLFINDIDINDYISSTGIIYIGQQESLFTGSILENINGYNYSMNNEEILAVSKICSVDQIVKRSSLGYNELVEENGFNFSGGERQRIILARAILNPFEVLIIDEGTNQMDINLERKILKSLFKKFNSKTVLFISHRLDNLDLFDHMVELESGKIVKDVRYNAAD